MAVDNSVDKKRCRELGLEGMRVMRKTGRTAREGWEANATACWPFTAIRQL